MASMPPPAPMTPPPSAHSGAMVDVEESVTVRALEEASSLLHDAMRLVKELGPVAPVPLHETSLTLAALDLALTFRVHTMLPGYAPGSRHTEVDFNCLKSAVKHLKKLGGPANHHPHGGYGGADSILLYLTHALATTVKCLRNLRRASRAKEQWCTRLRALAFVGLALLWRRRLSLFRLPVLQGRRVLLWLVGLSYLGRKLRYYALKRSVDDCHKRLLTILRLWVIMDCVMVYTENWKDGGVEYRTLIARLNQEDVRSKRWLSRQLLEAVPPPPETAFWYEASPVAAFLRRFMSVVYASFGVGVAACEALAGPGSAVAYASPGSAPILPSTQPALIAASSSTSAKGSSSKGAQRPPLLHKHPQLGWPLVGLPTTGLAFLYYALRPAAASRDACKRMSPAPIAMLQRAWTSLDNPVTRWVATALVAKRKGLAYQRRVTLGGIPCTVMARADPRGFARPRALFFVHGGGFVAHLFLADMAVLTSWTLGLGEEGVLLIPEYTLVPEGRYPKPITELLGAYRAALKGGEPLGFVPASLAVAGESAGGNLAAALLVAVGTALQLRDAHPHGGGGKASKRTKAGGPYPSPQHHPGLASMETLPTILYTGQSCQSLASCVEEGEGEEGAEEAEALRRASSVLASVGEGGMGLLLLPEHDMEQEEEDHAERPGTPAMVLGDDAEGVAEAAEAPSTPVKGEQAGGEGTGSGTSSEASSPSSESEAEAEAEGDEHGHGHDDEGEEEGGEGEAELAPLRMPDALVLFYPVLNFCLSPSPSRSVHMADPILPLGMFTTVADAYLPTHDTDPTRDPLISPYFVHDALLQRFWPPTFIGVGGFDPLLDDTVDFDVRLRHLGVPSTLRLGRDLPHGFFGLYDLDPSATKIMDEAARFLRAHLLPASSEAEAQQQLQQLPPIPTLLPPRAEREESDPCAGLEGSGDGEVNMLVMAGAAYHRHHAHAHAQGHGHVEAAAGGASVPSSS